MKGITPVIAVILLLIITISMIGFAFVWFQRVTATATNATEANLLNTVGTQQQTIRIDNVNNNSVTLRGTGTQSVTNNKIQIYINSMRVSPCSWDTPTLTPGGLMTCTFPIGTTCAPSGTIIKVTGPANPDQTLCP